MKHPIPAALLAASAAFALSACSTDYGYGGSSVSLGYNSGGYYGASPYYGWYDDFYYPGTGYYIYDRGGTRHRWNDGQRRYWEGRRGNRPGRDNWSGYRSGRNAGDAGWRQHGEGRRGRQSGQQMAQPQGTGEAATPSRAERQQAWRAQRQQQGEAAGQSRGQRSEAWRAQREQQGANGGWRGRGEGRRNRQD